MKTFNEIVNRKAFHDYEVLDQYEAGMRLQTEDVKKIIANKFSLTGNYVKAINGELFLIGESSSLSIKLLLHKYQIDKLIGKIQVAGLTVVPLRIISKNKKFKLVIAVAKGKKSYDKRDADKRRSIEDDNRRIIKSQRLE